VEFLATTTDLNLLAEALKALGFQVRIIEDGLQAGLQFAKYGCSGTYNKATGKLETRGFQGLDIDEVKRGYSEQVVNSQAKKFGWKIQWKTNDAGNREAEVEKRS
jgi:hypothetical protein